LDDEPGQCLGCGWECNICAGVCPNHANIVIRVAGNTGRAGNPLEEDLIFVPLMVPDGVVVVSLRKIRKN
jgi:hypothetical protein